MAKSKNKYGSAITVRLTRYLCYLTLLLTFSLIVPYWTALSAGLASTSLVVFTLTTIVTAFIVARSLAPKALALAALSSSVLALLLPQLLLVTSASENDVPLSLEPGQYLKYSGATDIEPTKIVTYKRASNADLQIAYYPTSLKGERPAIILLHGGGWRYGNYLETGLWPEYLTSHGFHVFSAEYRLSNDTYHTWKDAPADVHDAVTFVKENAKTFNVKPGSIQMMGQSAGGHLALLEAYRFNSVQSVVSLYSPVDLVLDYETSRDKSAEIDFIGGPPSQYLKRYEALNPLSYVSEDSPSTLAIQGTLDDLVSPENARQLRTALTEHGIEHEVIVLPFTGHSIENQRGGFATQIVKGSVINFLE